MNDKEPIPKNRIQFIQQAFYNIMNYHIWMTWAVIKYSA